MKTCIHFYYIQITSNISLLHVQITNVVLDVLAPGVILQADLSCWQKLVADMPQCSAPCRLTLLVCLLLASLSIVKPADVRNLFLVRTLFFLLLLLLALRNSSNAPLSSPVAPHMSQLISGEEALMILPIQCISSKNVPVLSELC